jgi:hypothetical protein
MANATMLQEFNVADVKPATAPLQEIPYHHLECG